MLAASILTPDMALRPNTTRCSPAPANTQPRAPGAARARLAVRTRRRSSSHTRSSGGAAPGLVLPLPAAPHARRERAAARW
jgi:hypothetical protein